MHLDVVGGEQDLVGLDINGHVAAGGAAVAAGDLGADAGGGFGVGAVELIHAPAEGGHQLVGRAHAAQARREPGDGAVEELEALGDGEAGGHGNREVSQGAGE